MTEDIKFRGRYIDIIEKTFKLSDGTVFKREIVRHPGAVVIVPFLNKDTVLMIRQVRQAVNETLLEFPAGTLEIGEDPLECAKRELAEEVGMKASRWESLGILYPAPGFCNEIQHCFAAYDLTEYKLEADIDEEITVETLSIQKVKDYIKSGELKDGKSISIFLKTTVV